MIEASLSGSSSSLRRYSVPRVYSRRHGARVGRSLQFLSHRFVSRTDHAQRAASSQYLAHGRALDVPTRILEVWSQGPAIRGRKG
jgi:hypothetical protein